MTALMLLAVMVDRNPFSMRLVAFAALAVLLLQPESLRRRLVSDVLCRRGRADRGL